MFKEFVIKMKLKKELTIEEYNKLSSDIQSDLRIIEHLIKCNPSAIAIISEKIDISKMILENYDLVQYLTTKQLKLYFDILDFSKIKLTKDIYDKLTQQNKVKVFETYFEECMNFFDTSEKEDAFFGIILAKLSNKNNDILPNKYLNVYNSCQLFPEEEIIKYILNLSPEEFREFFYLNNVVSDLKHTKIFFIQKYIFDLFLSLDEKTFEDKIELLKVIYDELPEELKDKFNFYEAGDNLDKIIQLPDEFQVEYFLNNINKLLYSSSEVQIKCLMKYEELTAELIIKHVMLSHERLLYKLSEEEREKLFSSNFLYVLYVFRFIDSSFNLDDFMINRLSQISDYYRRVSLIDLYNSLDEEKNISNDMNCFEQKYDFCRLIFEPEIVNNVDIELLNKYKDTFDRNLLIEILVSAYGEHVLEIFNERSQLDLEHIVCFKIFDKKIYDKLGKNFINHLLNVQSTDNYSIIFNLALGKLLNDDVALNNFVQYFNCIIEEYDKLDLNNITNLMEKFIIYEDIIKEIDFNNINAKIKNNLKLFVNDSKCFAIGVDNVSDLNNYLEIRKKRILEAVNEVYDVSEIKDLIYAYVFGRSLPEYYLFFTSNQLFERLSFENAYKIFNIENLVANQDMVKKVGLTLGEFSMLRILCEIKEENDIDILKNLCISLVNNNLDIMELSGTFDKIKNYYIEDVKRELFSSEMLENSEKTVFDGVEVVKFEGEEFTLICSTTGSNLSEMEKMATGSSGDALLNDWLSREDGVNIISTSLVSSDTHVYPIAEENWRYIKNQIIFVFDNDVDIVGMGATDIASEHKKRSFLHSFDFIGVSNYDHGFSSIKELKNRINKNNSKKFMAYNKDTKFENEITIARRREDVRKNGGGLKRVMPIAIYVIGKILPIHIETARAFNEYYEKNGLGKFRIIQVNPKCYQNKAILINNNSCEEKYSGERSK